MKSHRLIFLFTILYLSFMPSGLAQAEIDSTSNSVVDQFENVVKKSGSYKEYKVIEKVAIRNLQSKVKAEINQLEAEILSHSKTILEKNEKIEDLKLEVKRLNERALALENQQNEMKLFGTINLTKNTYRLILWLVVVLLLILLLFFMFRFRRSYIINSEIKENLTNLEDEFQNYKHNALEKQQKLGRQLQDAKNELQKNNRS